MKCIYAESVYRKRDGEMKQKIIDSIGKKNRSVSSMSVIKNHGLEKYVQRAYAWYVVYVKRIGKFQ